MEINGLNFSTPKLLPQETRGNFFSNLVRSVIDSGAELSGISGDYQPLIEQQIQLQEQMFLVSMQSNIEKSKHDIQMAAVRNIRVA